MPIFLDTRGRSSLGIAVCARCGEKFSRDDLHPDPNSPGLYVCDDDMDELDPYRLAPRETENITMEWCRPDAPITEVGVTHSFVPPPGIPGTPGTPAIYTYLTDELGNVFTDELGNPIEDTSVPVTPATPGTPGVPFPSDILPVSPWAPLATYSFGAGVTPLNENNPNVPLPQYQFVCIVSGTSGAVPPAWPRNNGVLVTDGTVTWICVGIYLDQGVGTAFPAPQPQVR